MASTTSALPHAQLKMRSLEAWYLSQFNPLLDNPAKCLRVSPELSHQLTWGTFVLHLLIGRPFKPLQLTVQVTTDASRTGWGAHCAVHKIHALLSSSKKLLHINLLEILAVIKALRAFYPLVVGCRMQVATDNITTLYYINKQGGTHSLSLLYLAIHLWEWCYNHHIFPIAIHVSTEDNDVADHLSRLATRVLNDSVFAHICSRCSTLAIDVFATQINAKCKKVCSRARRGNGSLGNGDMGCCPSLSFSSHPAYSTDNCQDPPVAS